MKQFVSIKETKQKHIVFQMVICNYCLKLLAFDGNDV